MAIATSTKGTPKPGAIMQNLASQFVGCFDTDSQRYKLCSDRSSDPFSFALLGVSRTAELRLRVVVVPWGPLHAHTSRMTA
jgi:hypothetical protein